MRIGHGYDVHRFGAGDSVVLGGVRIAHDRGLQAHSDGDVLLHAICDALLGALGRGDIGHHFPDSDPANAGIDSRELLRRVIALLRADGWEVANLDATLILEAPRLAPHIAAMRANIAQDLSIDRDARLHRTPGGGGGARGNAAASRGAMNPRWPRAWGPAPASAVLRARPEDFDVTELPGFEAEGAGEHVFLFVEKRRVNTLEVVGRLSRLSGVPRRDIGYSGLKDRDAVSRQWFSVALPGRPEPDWGELEDAGHVRLLKATRHRRKLRRGSHRGNRFRLVLRALDGDRRALEERLLWIQQHGAPNYFGEQRFGRNGSTLEQARHWVTSGDRVSRTQRGLYYSALRAFLFNSMLASRVGDGSWNRIVPGDICMLAGSHSFFRCAQDDAAIAARLAGGDIHPGLPLWGRADGAAEAAELPALPADCDGIGAFLERAGLALAWRATRLLPDDFCWRFCDDDSLQLDFVLGAGSYATALLAELVHYSEGSAGSGAAGEQG